MNAEMTLDELRRLSDAATPGEWHSGTNDGWLTDVGQHVWVPEGPGSEDGTFVAYTGHDDWDHSVEDAAFIVAAVNYVRSILQEQPR